MKIRSICADLFSFEGRLDWEHPIALRIELFDGLAIRIRTGRDGESLIVDDRSLDGPVNMAEFGSIEVRDLADRLENAVFSSEITAMNKVVHGDDIVVGLAFADKNGPVLCVWNYGDELHYGRFADMVAQDWGVKPRVSDIEFLPS